VARSPAQLVRATGRMLLWCLVAVLLLRGAGDVLATTAERPAAQQVRQTALPSWPDDRARAFAGQFTRAYLGYSGQRAPAESRELLGLVAPELADSVLPQFEHRGSRPIVHGVVVAGVDRLDERHALVTVAATLASGAELTTRFLVVPLGRDGHGGLVVYDLPAFAAAPARAQVRAVEHEPLTGADAAPIEDVLTRFFRAFLAGRSDELEYLVPTGVRIGALADPVELVGVDSIAELEPARERGRLVLVTVRARDLQTRAVYPLRYRVRLVRGDRWYVAAINTTRQGG
jgi:hypothetical protein